MLLKDQAEAEANEAKVRSLCNFHEPLYMNKMIGKTIMISGMIIEIISDDGDSWMVRNATTHETVSMKKSILSNAIKLGKAEEVIEQADKE